MLQSARHSYSDGEAEFSGFLVWDDDRPTPMPGVLVTPAFGGLGPFEKERAENLARLGYVALAVDYYGGGKRAASEDEAYQWMGLLDGNRPLLASRMVRALDQLKSLPQVNADSVAAIGYCFGGKAVLDLARTGAELRAVVSFHGVYDPPPAPANQMASSVLIIHGWDDPLAKPDQLIALAAELTARCTDWQLLAFGHTGHAFTNPNVNRPENGMQFNEIANRRSWDAMERYLDERLRSY